MLSSSRTGRALCSAAVFCIFPTLLSCSGESEAEFRPVGTRSELADAIKSLQVGAAIGTDDAFDHYKLKHHLIPALIAPKGFRKLLSQPNVQTWDRVKLTFRWEKRDVRRLKKGRVSLTWSGTIEVRPRGADALKMLLAAVENAGYKDATGKLATHLTENYKIVRQHLVGPRKRKLRRADLMAFSRPAGSAREELVINEFYRQIGGGRLYRGGFALCVECDYTDGPPTWETLLKAFSAISPVHPQPAVFERLKTEPVYCFSIDRGWSLLTSKSVRPDLEAAFKQDGFVFSDRRKRPRTPTQPQSTTFTWARRSDWTFAHITPEEDNRITVHVQAPQRKKKP